MPNLNIELRNLRLEKIKKENWFDFCKKYQNLGKENLEIQDERATLITELDAEMDKVVSGILIDLNQNLLDLGADFSIFKLEHKRKIKTTDKSLYSLLFKNKILPLVAEKGSYCFNNILSDSDRKVLALAFFLATVNKKRDAIIVFDDPVNSFDNERKRAITKKIGELKNFVKQIIILTHDEGFLREINWEPNLSENCFMVIENNGTTSFLENSHDIKDYLEDNHKKRIKRLIKMQSTGNFENNFEAECRKLMEHVFELKHHSELIGAELKSIGGYSEIIFNGKQDILDDFNRLGKYLHPPLHDSSIPEIGKIDNQTTLAEFFKCLKYI